jgi:hypothetical protein
LGDAAFQSRRLEVSEGEATGPVNFPATAIRVASFIFWFAAFCAYAAAFRDQPRPLFALICLAFGSLISTTVHEAGHALTAVACGWRVLAFVVRPFGLQLPNRNLAIMSRALEPAAAGWVATVPRSIEAGTTANWRAILLSGPIISLILSAVAFLAAATVLVEFDSHSTVMVGSGSLKWAIQTQPVMTAPLAIGLGIQSLHSAIFSFLPSARGEISTDGTQWRAAGRPDDNREIDAPFIWLQTLATYQVRLRDRPAWMVTAAEAVRHPTEEGTSHITQYLAGARIGTVLDSVTVDVALARNLIDAYRATYGDGDWLAACDAWLAAIWEGDAERASAALARHRGKTTIPQMTLAAEAAIAARSGDASTAKARLREMDKEIRQLSPFRDETFRDIRRQVEALLG